MTYDNIVRISELLENIKHGNAFGKKKLWLERALRVFCDFFCPLLFVFCDLLAQFVELGDVNSMNQKHFSTRI